jgi:hypothetical protein
VVEEKAMHPSMRWKQRAPRPRSGSVAPASEIGDLRAAIRVRGRREQRQEGVEQDQITRSGR